MGLRVVIRVDASPQIGTGHFMRCLTLADALAVRRAEVRLVSRHLPDHLKVLARSHGFECLENRSAAPPLSLGGPPHANWLDTSQQADADDTVRALAGTTCDWLVVDHYSLDAVWESAMRAVAPRILAIDDVADRAHACDMLLDQNLFADMDTRYLGKVPKHCRVMLGPKFALLRPEFRARRATLTRRACRLEHVLVCFGGVDAQNLTARALSAIDSAGQGLSVEVIIGPQHPDRDAIVSACAQRAFSCHVQSDQMAALMAAADLAYGASGSTSWERCCLGLPTICVATADNQIAIAGGLERAGAAVVLGGHEPVSVEAMAEALASLRQQPERLRMMSDAAMALVDGLGAERISDAMRSF